MILDLDEKYFKRMEGSLADDEDFQAQIKKLEAQYGPLIKNEDTRERFKLDKAVLYARTNQESLEETLKNMKRVRNLGTDILEIVNDDTDKLRAAFEEVDLLRRRTKRSNRICCRPIKSSLR
jgi:endonuclease III